MKIEAQKNMMENFSVIDNRFKKNNLITATLNKTKPIVKCNASNSKKCAFLKKSIADVNGYLTS